MAIFKTDETIDGRPVRVTFIPKDGLTLRELAGELYYAPGAAEGVLVHRDGERRGSVVVGTGGLLRAGAKRRVLGTVIKFEPGE